MDNELRKVEAISEFVDMLVRTVDPGEDEGRQHRDKIRHRVMYGLKIEDTDLLKALGAPETWLLDLELGNGWARNNWPDANFDPARIVPPPLVDVLVLGEELIDWHISGDIVKCQAQVDHYYAVIRRMRDAIRDQEREIRRLRPLAERFEYICATNRRSAKKPRNV